MPYSHLTREQRFTIHTELSQGSSQTDVALKLGVHRCTISREIKRNATSSQGYQFLDAEISAQERRANGLKERARFSPEDWERVEEHLQLDWSPEQVSNKLRDKGFNVPCPESIYQYIYRDKKSAGTLYKHLRRHRKTYRKRGNPHAKAGQIKNRVDIDQRPPEVDEKHRIGDWEADTVIGQIGGSVLVTLVDRLTRYTLIAKAPSKQSLEVATAMLGKLVPNKEKVLTITYDNGKEFARHQFVDKMLDSQGYFAKPYHSWQRGLNENTNGLIRQYFPKKSNFDPLTDDEILAVQNKLNQRPRKCLGYKTPNDMFLAN